MEALSSISSVIAGGFSVDGTLCKLVSACLLDNNQKISATACGMILSIAEAAAGNASVLEVFVDPLVELIGNAKVSS